MSVADKELVVLAARGVHKTWDAVAIDIMQCSDKGLNTTYTAAEVIETVCDHMFMYAGKDNFAAYELLEEELGWDKLVPILATEMGNGIYGY